MTITSVTSMPASLRSFTDAAADAVARAIAGVQRDAQREREIRDAEHRARLAELDARISSVAALEIQVRDRLATLKDGADGKPGERGADGLAGRDGVDGKDGMPGENGKDGERGADGADGRDGADGKDGVAGRDGENGRDGKDGERGAEGPVGKLPTVREWDDRVFYEGEVAALDGRSFQALRDTGRKPPHADWICIADRGADGAHGRDGADGEDGRSFRVRGTWLEIVDDYRALDVVALNGASFIAKKDDPGACPGEGWQMIAGQGKRGQPGQKGDRGERGPAGMPVVAAQITADGILILTNGDGTTVDCDLYPVLTKVAQ